MDNNANGLIDLKSVMPNEVAETLPGILSSESKSPSEVGENHPQLDTGVVTTLNETNGENSSESKAHQFFHPATYTKFSQRQKCRRRNVLRL